MYPTMEQIVASNKAGSEVLIAISNIQAAAFERFSALTFNAAKSLFEDSLEQAKAVLGAKDAQELIGLNSAAAQPSIEKALAYSRSMCDIALQAQREMTKVMEAYASELKNGIRGDLEKASHIPPPGSDAAAAAVKSALAAAGSVYESLSKISKQATELTDADLASAVQGVKERRKRTA